MAQQNLQTNVIVSGSVVKSGFGEIKTEFIALSELAQQLSDQLINFGKESAETYGQYEQNMADAKAAMATGTYKDDLVALNKAMSGLDAYAKKWAETTKFTTSDVSNAISEAAHAGWDYTQMIEGIPDAMLLAQAGGIELSTAMDYIVKSANATKTPFAELGGLIDEWVVAANTGATNVDEIGQAMVKLGQVSTFADTTAELMAMLTILANSGSVGTEAGTLLRNTMIRLVAPTDKAGKAMQALGVDADEMEEALNGDNEALSSAMEALSEFGFSAYDKNGNLKSFLEIFTSLNAALSGMTEEGRNDVLSTIFPQRSITGAKALLDGIASGDWEKVYASILTGAGAAQKASDIMMDTQEGDLKILESRIEALKLAVGEELTGQIREFAEGMGGFINGITNLDPAVFSGLVAGLETIAGLGSALGVAGAAVKVFATLGVAGGIGATALAVTALAAGIAVYSDNMAQAQNKGLFGTMELDTTALTEYATTIGGQFDAAATQINGFNTALETSATNYSTAAAGLSGTLLQKMLTGGTLNQTDKDALYNLGDDMYKSLIDGITNGTASSMTFWEYLFGGSGTAEKDEDYQTIIGTLNTGYEGALAEAQALGQGLRDALTSAFDDGQINEEEYNNILSYMQSYNEAIAKASAQATAEQDLIDAQVALAKSQNMSLDSLLTASTTITGKRDAGLDELETMYLQNYFRLKNAGASDDELAAAEAAYMANTASYSGNYDSILTRLWTQGIAGSGMSQGFEDLQGIAYAMLAGLSPENALTAAGRIENGANMQKYIEGYISQLGGTNSMLERIGMYEDAGNTDMANQFRTLLMMQQLIAGANSYSDAFSYNSALGSLENLTATIESGMGTESAKSAIDEGQAYADSHPIYVKLSILGGLTNIMDRFNWGGGGGGEFANGGRATEASIFGEAGAEWAIPEAHTSRTAELLDSARKASGFTWPELLARTGGLNANASNVPSTFVYSPTINAGNADGVASALEQDKARLESWWRQMQQRERMVSYA